MATLHTVNKSPFERVSMATAFGHAARGDSVLIIEDGVYGVRKGTTIAKTIEESRAVCEVYALGPDLAARGIKTDNVIEGVKVVGYDGFVELVAGHARVCAWL
jgi:tRNA 2-thiouridine synthesizing protein B